MKDARTVLITGASAGIGRATALALVRNGHEVWGTSRNVQRLADIPGIRPIALDLGDQTSIDEALRVGLREVGGFDVVINNAGSGVWGPLEHLSSEQETEQFQLLVFGPMQLIRGVLPSMRERGHGVIINVTSLAAQFSVPFLGAYSAAKAAMASMTWSLQMELINQPIRFVDLRPGDINSEFNEVMNYTQKRIQDGYVRNMERAFEIYDSGMRSAPPPELVAERLVQIVERNGTGSPVVSIGNVFQARVAPFLTRFASARVVRWFTGRYYGLRR